MSSNDSCWKPGPDACVVYVPAEESVPPRLVVDLGGQTVTLVAPTNREDFRHFTRFVGDLAAGATELRLDCHPALAWGRQVFSKPASGE
jgi:hypothetical protein